jgi:protein gp37
VPTVFDQRRSSTTGHACGGSADHDRGGCETGGVADKSAIEWTEATWNPTTGCDRITAGCDNCYALTLAKRLKAMGNAKYQLDGDPRTSGPGFGLQMHQSALEIPLNWSAPRVVFVNSMSDLFHAKVTDDFIERVFDVMASTPRHTYQLLTKRPIRLARLASRLPWPNNIWVGVSVEHNAQAWRLDRLREVPAAVRFVSAEPLLGRLDAVDLSGVDWLIAGGESGHHARPMDPEWVEHLRRRCGEEGVAFFFKQWGGRTPKAHGRELHGRTFDEMPVATPRWTALAV